MTAPPRNSRLALAAAFCSVLVTAAHPWRVYREHLDALSDQNHVVTTQVSTGPFDHFVLEQGEVESAKNEYVVCEVQAARGGIRILWVIPDGTDVKKGDLLVELDSSGLDKLLTAQRVIVSGAEATLARSKANAEVARIALDQYMQGTFQSNQKALLSQIANAKQNVRKAELILRTTERLASQGTLSDLQIESARFTRDNALNALDDADARLRVLEELTKEKFEVQLESNILAAEARVAAHEGVLRYQLERQRQLEDQIDKCTIRAPADGTVIHANLTGRSSYYEFIVEAGAYVRERQVLIKLPDLNRLQVKAAFNQTRINDVNEGMPARIRLDALPGVELQGKVTYVKKWPERDRYGSYIREFTGYIEITDAVETVQVGMTAEVEVYAGHIPDAVQVAIESIYGHLERYFCLRMMTGNQWETVEVTIRATNGAMAVIDSGLAPGDVVALHPHAHRDLLNLPTIDPYADREVYRKLAAEPPAKAHRVTPADRWRKSNNSDVQRGAQ